MEEKEMKQEKRKKGTRRRVRTKVWGECGDKNVRQDPLSIPWRLRLFKPSCGHINASCAFAIKR